MEKSVSTYHVGRGANVYMLALASLEKMFFVFFFSYQSRPRSALKRGLGPDIVGFDLRDFALRLQSNFFFFNAPVETFIVASRLSVSFASPAIQQVFALVTGGKKRHCLGYERGRSTALRTPANGRSFGCTTHAPHFRLK